MKRNLLGNLYPYRGDWEQQLCRSTDVCALRVAHVSSHSCHNHQCPIQEQTLRRIHESMLHPTICKNTNGGPHTGSLWCSHIGGIKARVTGWGVARKQSVWLAGRRPRVQSPAPHTEKPLQLGSFIYILFSWFWESNPGSYTCWGRALPLSHVPSQDQMFIVCLFVCFWLFEIGSCWYSLSWPQTCLSLLCVEITGMYYLAQLQVQVFKIQFPHLVPKSEYILGRRKALELKHPKSVNNEVMFDLGVLNLAQLNIP